MKPFYQVAFAVQDLEAAMDELSRIVGARWHRPVGDGNPRVAISIEGPPHIELIEAPPGSTWDSSAGSRFDHLQWWSTDLEADTRRLEAEGLVLEHDLGMLRYFRAPKTGFRVELLRGDPDRQGGVPEDYVRTVYGSSGEWDRSATAQDAST